ncbi:MAG: FtsX-like permease family protein [Pseudoduganella sp.]|jgi:putative ABC transport system permease protein|nr:FtsX-like permease family protein [Pseudoduganella sp.]
MLSPRWRKLLGDVRMAPGKTVLMLLAIGLGVFAMMTTLGSYTILKREIGRSYQVTNPPSATLTVDTIDAGLLAEVRRLPGIAHAEAAGKARATVRGADGKWLPLTIFISPDLGRAGIGAVQAERGAWPAPEGAMLLERDALGLAGVRQGQSLTIRTRDGSEHQLPLAGTVHDASLPPASQGTTVYAYATPATVASLGLDAKLRLLQVTVREGRDDMAAIDREAARLAAWLRSRGHTVERMQVPPPGRHPHADISDAVLDVQLALSILTLLLGAVISASVVHGMVARQAQQIGVMKALGATTGQVASLYLLLVGVLAAVATAAGMTGGVLAARAIADQLLSRALNFSMYSAAIPATVYGATFAAGIVLPLLSAALPVLQHCLPPPLRSISANGCASNWYAPSSRWLPPALRNALRRRGQLALSLLLLGCAGAFYLASVNLRLAADRHLLQAAAERLHDIEFHLDAPAPAVTVLERLAGVPGVVRAEPMSQALAAPVGERGEAIERVYPDGDHGALLLANIAQDTQLLKLEMLSGRWLQPGDTGAAVLNSRALDLLPAAKVGDTLRLSSRGKPVNLLVVGIARQFMSPATVFVTPPTFAPLMIRPAHATAYRVRLDRHDDASIEAAAGRIEAMLLAHGMRSRMTITEPMVRKDVDGHFDLLLLMLKGFAVLAAAVGMLGLAMSMAVAVAQRRREFAIMHCLGAGLLAVQGTVLGEALWIATASIPFAVAAALPLSAGLGAWLGNLLFGLPFPLAVSWPDVAVWSACALASSVLASAWPAWRAAVPAIRESLAFG